MVIVLSWYVMQHRNKIRAYLGAARHVIESIEFEATDYTVSFVAAIQELRGMHDSIQRAAATSWSELPNVRLHLTEGRCLPQND